MHSSDKPINQFSLNDLELWLKELGANVDIDDPSKWHLKILDWDAIINFEKDDLSVVWNCNGELTRRLFSYRINIEDVENAILQGP